MSSRNVNPAQFGPVSKGETMSRNHHAALGHSEARNEAPWPAPHPETSAAHLSWEHGNVARGLSDDALRLQREAAGTTDKVARAALNKRANDTLKSYREVYQKGLDNYDSMIGVDPTK